MQTFVLINKKESRIYITRNTRSRTIYIYVATTSPLRICTADQWPGDQAKSYVYRYKTTITTSRYKVLTNLLLLHDQSLQKVQAQTWQYA
jgi:hypothetical protein